MRIALCYTIFFLFCLSANGQKNVVLEKFTNSHCGVCPNAALLIQDIVDENPNTFWLSHQKPFLDHPFHNDESVTLYNDLNLLGAPHGMFDRIPVNGKITHHQNQWVALVNQQLALPEEAKVEIKNVVFHSDERKLSFDTEVSFSTVPDAGPFKLSAFIVEDSVQGEPQDNYYNDVPGHPLEGLGDEIWSYYHRNLVRNVLDAPWGSNTTIPNVPTLNQVYSQSFEYIIPENFNQKRMHIVCAVSFAHESDVTQRSFLNADKFMLRSLPNIQTSSKDLNADDFIQINIFPNPVSDQLTLRFSDIPTTVVMINANGEKLKSFKLASKELNINVSNLSDGIYFLLIEKEGRIMRKRFVVSK